MILGMDHNLDFLKSHLHENMQSIINYNLDNDLFPVITRPTHITHSTATLIDNIFLESRLTGQMTSKILIDDISDHLPCVTIIGNWKHAFVYTQMFWWTTLLYTWPVQEKELMDKCEVVLVYMKLGVFGELQKICPLTTSSPRVETSLPTVPPLVIPQNAEEITPQIPTMPTSTSVITGGTSSINPVPTGSASDNDSTTTASAPPVPQGCAESSDMVITMSAPLPKIDIFMTQHCSIPLI